MSQQHIMLLSDPLSSHTLKIVRALSDNGFRVSVVGMRSYSENLLDDIPAAQVFSLGLEVQGDDWSKLKYFTLVPKFRKIVKALKPDIVHGHFASSYGLIAVLNGVCPTFLTLWGGDVLIFPKKSFLHKLLFEFNLAKATKIFSTSQFMVDEAVKYTSKDIEVIPFGVDAKKFSPNANERSTQYFNENDLVIGTVKALEHIYGVDILLKTFARLVEAFPEVSLKLLLVGGGSKLGAYQELASDLQISDRVVFAGKVHQDETPLYYHMLDIYVALSRSESFGVAIIEAMACSKPVVVSDAGGPCEIVENGETGLIVPRESIDGAYQALMKLIKSKDLRERLGENARAHVIKHYDWNKNSKSMIQSYKNFLNSSIDN